MRRNNPNHQAHIKHRDQSPHSYHLPTPPAEIDKHQNRTYTNQKGIGTDFHFAKISIDRFGNSQRKAFPGKHQRIATHFASDAKRQYGSTDEQLDKSQRIAYHGIHIERNLQKARQPHRQVGIESEKKRDQNLSVLAFFKILPQQQNLHRDEKHMHTYRQLPHRETYPRDKRQNIRRSRNRRRPEIGTNRQRCAE